MCGIVGYVGNKQAGPILLEGLEKLEYRGYDSAGVAVRDGDKEAEVVKTLGRLQNLVERTDSGKAVKYVRNRSHPLGNPRRAQQTECASACVRKLYRFRLRQGRISRCRRSQRYH